MYNVYTAYALHHTHCTAYMPRQEWDILGEIENIKLVQDADDVKHQNKKSLETTEPGLPRKTQQIRAKIVRRMQAVIDSQSTPNISYHLINDSPGILVNK